MIDCELRERSRARGRDRDRAINVHCTKCLSQLGVAFDHVNAMYLAARRVSESQRAQRKVSLLPGLDRATLLGEPAASHDVMRVALLAGSFRRMRTIHGSLGVSCRGARRLPLFARDGR